MFSFLMWVMICAGMGWNPFQAHPNPQTGVVEFTTQSTVKGMEMTSPKQKWSGGAQ